MLNRHRSQMETSALDNLIKPESTFILKYVALMHLTSNFSFRVKIRETTLLCTKKKEKRNIAVVFVP